MYYNLERVLEYGVLTGSRAFNCATPESDWDIVITQNHSPNYEDAPTVLNVTHFNDCEWVENPNDGKSLIDLSAHAEFEDDGFIEYDQYTIWGPLTSIIKYVDDFGNTVNLFIYPEGFNSILAKFIELNKLMNFIYGPALLDKPTRNEAFTKVIERVGITNHHLL